METIEITIRVDGSKLSPVQLRETVANAVGDALEGKADEAHFSLLGKPGLVIDLQN